MNTKEAYRLFFMVKGHLNCDENTAIECADGYFKRLWYDGADGAPLYDYSEQFELAWEKKLNDQQKNRESKY
jgi:hypothetical protein